MFKLFLSIAIISICRPLDKVLKRERVNKALFTSIILTIERVVQFLLSTCVLCTHRSKMVLSKQSAEPLKDSSIKSAGNSRLKSSQMKKKKLYRNKDRLSSNEMASERCEYMFSYSLFYLLSCDSIFILRDSIVMHEVILLNAIRLFFYVPSSPIAKKLWTTTRRFTIMLLCSILPYAIGCHFFESLIGFATTILIRCRALSVYRLNSAKIQSSSQVMQF